jgi:hypothetical protein
MSGPARKKVGDTRAAWVDGDEEQALRAKAQARMSVICAKVAEVRQDPGLAKSIEAILTQYERNREQPAEGVDLQAVMGRRAALLKKLPEILALMAEVIEDHQSRDFLVVAYDALAATYAHLLQNPPTGRAESEADARGAAVRALDHLLQTRGLPSDKVVYHSGLINYENEEQFQRALNRARSGK